MHQRALSSPCRAAPSACHIRAYASHRTWKTRDHYCSLSASAASFDFVVWLEKKKRKRKTQIDCSRPQTWNPRNSERKRSNSIRVFLFGLFYLYPKEISIDVVRKDSGVLLSIVGFKRWASPPFVVLVDFNPTVNNFPNLGGSVGDSNHGRLYGLNRILKLFISIRMICFSELLFTRVKSRVKSRKFNKTMSFWDSQ